MRTPKLFLVSLILAFLLVAAPGFGQGKKESASAKQRSQPISQQVQESLIALDKQWGEAGSKGDTATLNKILADSYMGIGEKGEMLDKQQQVSATTATNANVQNAAYTADEYKFESLAPTVVVMTHRASVKGTQAGKEATESHRSLHVFQKQGGQWKVVASTQLPIK